MTQEMKALEAAQSLIKEIEKGRKYYLGERYIYRPYLDMDRVEVVAILVDAALDSNKKKEIENESFRI